MDFDGDLARLEVKRKHFGTGLVYLSHFSYENINRSTFIGNTNATREFLIKITFLFSQFDEHEFFYQTEKNLNEQNE